MEFSDCLKNLNQKDLKTIGEIIYPVGSLYSTFERKSPYYFFGGKWEEIKENKFYCRKKDFKKYKNSQKTAYEMFPRDKESSKQEKVKFYSFTDKKIDRIKFFILKILKLKRVYLFRRIG